VHDAHDDPDHDLFVAWRNGDSKAGDALFLRHFDDLFGFLRGKVGEAAEDLTQLTWMKLVQGADGFSGEGTFRGYLFGVARNTFYDHLRSKYRRDKRHADAVDILERSLDDLEVSPFTAMAERQEVILFARALRKIPLDSQILFELHYWQKLPAPQLAITLKLPEGTVRSRLRRAKELVREQMSVLASSSEELASTLSGFDTWSDRLRALAVRRGD
jgi:RNA polymerase sigma factor (sigma-70 family)